MWRRALHHLNTAFNKWGLCYFHSSNYWRHIWHLLHVTAIGFNTVPVLCLPCWSQFLQVSIPICFQTECCLLNDCAYIFPNFNVYFLDQTQMKRGSKDTGDWKETVLRGLHSSSVVCNHLPCGSQGGEALPGSQMLPQHLEVSPREWHGRVQ